jgi:hypothetical protein
LLLSQNPVQHSCCVPQVVPTGWQTGGSAHLPEPLQNPVQQSEGTVQSPVFASQLLQ